MNNMSPNYYSLKSCYSHQTKSHVNNEKVCYLENCMPKRVKWSICKIEKDNLKVLALVVKNFMENVKFGIDVKGNGMGKKGLLERSKIHTKKLSWGLKWDNLSEADHTSFSYFCHFWNATHGCRKGIVYDSWDAIRFWYRMSSVNILTFEDLSGIL